jgi:membrane protein YdbS with pleckstrin-like domain
MQLRPSLKFVKLSYVFCLLLAVGLGVYILAVPDHPDWAVWGFLLPAILAFFTVIRHVQRRMMKVTISDDRVREEVGWFGKSTRTIELIKIQEVTVRQSIWQRIFGLGDLSMQTAGTSSDVSIRSIDRPQQAADHIHELVRVQRTKPDDSPHPGNP